MKLEDDLLIACTQEQQVINAKHMKEALPQGSPVICLLDCMDLAVTCINARNYTAGVQDEKVPLLACQDRAMRTAAYC